MSKSEPAKNWPNVERRVGVERRVRADRRSAPSAAAPTQERRAATRRSGRDRRSDSGWQPVSLDAPSSSAGDDALLAAAIEAREHAQALYSGFKVGAALESLDGAVITGCNIENATYGLTICAERVALFKALSEGHTAFTRIAVIADTPAPTPPCGSCRQLLWEYCGDIDVILGNLSIVTGRHRLAGLFPLPFDKRNL